MCFSRLLGRSNLVSGGRVIPSATLTALAMALIVALSGCSGGDDGESNGSASGGGTTATTTVDTTTPPSDSTEAGDDNGGAGEDTTLTASDFAWSEDTLRLSKDTTTLKVTNSDRALHSFTAQSINVDEDVQGGESVDVKIDLSSASGRVDFVCKYHPDMTGKIEVT